MAPLSEAEQLTTLLELQRDLALEANVDKVLLRITLAATHMLDADRATLYVVDQAKNLIWSRVLTEGGERGESVAQIREIRLPLDGRGLATEVARNGHLLRIDDPYDDPRFDPSVDARERRAWNRARRTPCQAGRAGRPLGSGAASRSARRVAKGSARHPLCPATGHARRRRTRARGPRTGRPDRRNEWL